MPTDEERAKQREEQNRQYVASQLEAYTKAGYICRAVGVRPFVIGMRSKDSQVELLFTDYCDDGTSHALLTRADLDWIAETGARLLA